MLWFTVWTVLVLATLAGAAWLGRDLWRKGKALMAEVERASALMERMADHADELAAAAAHPPTNDLLTDPAQHRERLAALAERRRARRLARAERHRATFTRWQAYTR